MQKLESKHDTKATGNKLSQEELSKADTYLQILLPLYRDKVTGMAKIPAIPNLHMFYARKLKKKMIVLVHKHLLILFTRQYVY